MTSFEGLGLDQWLGAQCAAMALQAPTEVQQACIPQILKGQHVVGGAATGSGKTAAFALPIIQLLSADMYGVFSLVVTPSRELAYQIIDQFVAFGAPVAIRTATIIGGTPHGDQRDALLARPHVVVATPGRLRMLFETFPEVLAAMRNLRFLVLDEADRLIDGDIQHDVFRCVALLGQPKAFRRTLLFTATADERLLDVAVGVLPQLGVTEQASLAVCCCSTAETTRHEYAIAPNLAQEFLFVPNDFKLQYLVILLRSLPPKGSVIIFCNSCFRSEIVRLTLQLLGFPVCSLNALLTQKKRLTNLALFKAGVATVLVATDIAARGLDIPEVGHVLHYDFPKLSATYVHRVGRTARAGRSGTSVAIISQHDVSLVHKVERKTHTKLRKFSDAAVGDDAVLSVLDEVSAAKVEAKLQIDAQFGTRAATLKAIGEERRPERNRAIRDDGRRRPQSAPAHDTAPSAPPTQSTEPLAEEATVTMSPKALERVAGSKRKRTSSKS